MDNDFISKLKNLINEQGKEVFLNATRCKAFLADYTHGEYKKESRLLLQVIEAGTAKEIDTADDIEVCKKQQIRILREECFLDEDVSSDVIDALALVLRNIEIKKTNIKNESQPTVINDIEQKIVKQTENTNINDTQFNSTTYSGFSTQYDNYTQSTENIDNTGKEKKSSAAGIFIFFIVVIIIIFISIIGNSNQQSQSNRGSASAASTGSQTNQSTQTPRETFTERFTHTDLNVRARATVDSPSRMTIRPDTRIRVSNLNSSGVWVKVNHNNTEGFVNSTFLRDFRITEILVGDKLQSGAWNRNPGTQLTGNQIQYLGIQVRIETTNSYNANTSFRIRIIDPNGNPFHINQNTPAPGFTYVQTARVNNTGLYDLGGFGDPNRRIYYRGTWRVEIWYANPNNLANTNVVIASRTFRFD